MPRPIPVLGIIGCVIAMTQVEGETWLRAAALLGLGLVLWAVERLATSRTAPART